MPESFEPTRERIEQRAYELFEERGGEYGADLDDWLTAEQQLREQASQEELETSEEVVIAHGAATTEELPEDPVFEGRQKPNLRFPVGATP